MRLIGTVPCPVALISQHYQQNTVLTSADEARMDLVSTYIELHIRPFIPSADEKV